MRATSIDALVQMVMRIITMPTAEACHAPRPRGAELPKDRRRQDELIEADD